MADPFTIRIFVPDGEPEGVRLIDRMNWTGLGMVFPRTKWPEVRQRSEMQRTGVYILVGYKEDDDDLGSRGVCPHNASRLSVNIGNIGFLWQARQRQRWSATGV